MSIPSVAIVPLSLNDAESWRQDLVNERVYFAPGVERCYRSRVLTPVETTALVKYRAAFVNRDVLDIGVGTGRTTLHLQPMAHRYEGIDYSPVMVRHMRAAMPGAAVRQIDMRDLSAFDEAGFDTVFATGDVLDTVSHADRLRTLREAARVLRPGGLFMFSSHNLACRRAGHFPTLGVSAHPVAQARHVARWLRQLANHARIARLRQARDGHALLNDAGHDFACLHYYVDPAAQRRQLVDAGFELIDVIDASGHCVGADDACPESPSLMFVACRHMRGVDMHS